MLRVSLSGVCLADGRPEGSKPVCGFDFACGLGFSTLPGIEWLLKLPVSIEDDADLLMPEAERPFGLLRKPASREAGALGFTAEGTAEGGCGSCDSTVCKMSFVRCITSAPFFVAIFLIAARKLPKSMTACPRRTDSLNVNCASWCVKRPSSKLACLQTQRKVRASRPGSLPRRLSKACAREASSTCAHLPSNDCLSCGSLDIPLVLAATSPVEAARFNVDDKGLSGASLSNSRPLCVPLELFLPTVLAKCSLLAASGVISPDKLVGLKFPVDARATLGAPCLLPFPAQEDGNKLALPVGVSSVCSIKELHSNASSDSEGRGVLDGNGFTSTAFKKSCELRFGSLTL
mmetsp:Transcript_52575/g.118365  ORF Transcript_52575/g.118365 Transcript_52575/m.118365 type:complete len:347 (+) Transcript_52575:899-1939(+)